MSEGQLAITQQAFQERVKNHMKDVIGSLIPDDQFGQMVNAEIKAFFETPVEYLWESGGYSSGDRLKTKITPFRQLVWSHVKPVVEGELRKWFDGDQKANFEKFVAEMIAMPATGERTSLNTQQLMMAMAGQMFYGCAIQANMQVRSDLMAIFQRYNFPYGLISELSVIKEYKQYIDQPIAPGSEVSPTVQTVSPSN